MTNRTGNQPGSHRKNYRNEEHVEVRYEQLLSILFGKYFPRTYLMIVTLLVAGLTALIVVLDGASRMEPFAIAALVGGGITSATGVVAVARRRQQPRHQRR